MKWRIRSSSGREHISVEFIEQCKKNKEIFLVGKVEISGAFWWRHGKKFGSDCVEDFTVILHQVDFSKTCLHAFLQNIHEWPLKPSPIFFESSPNPRGGQNLILTFDKSDTLISTIERPACTLEYYANAFQYGKWAFVIDQSCIRLLVDELSEALSSIERQSAE